MYALPSIKQRHFSVCRDVNHGAHRKKLICKNQLHTTEANKILSNADFKAEVTLHVQNCCAALTCSTQLSQIKDNSTYQLHHKQEALIFYARFPSGIHTHSQQIPINGHSRILKSSML